MKPIIGVTVSPDTVTADYGVSHRYRAGVDYIDAVSAAGGLPVMLSPRVEDIDQILQVVDGLLFTGGADLDPSLYGDEAVHPETYGVDQERDTFEIALIRAAAAADKPMLCICRGIQVLNVAFGGSLDQHLADETGSDEGHRQYKRGLDAAAPGHSVTTTEGGLLRSITGTGQLPVNSLHHQGLRVIGDGLTVEAITEDGLVESVSVPTCGFALAVQWHPEMMFRTAELQRSLFDAFLEAVRSRQLTPTQR